MRSEGHAQSHLPAANLRAFRAVVGSVRRSMDLLKYRHGKQVKAIIRPYR